MKVSHIPKLVKSAQLGKVAVDDRYRDDLGRSELSFLFRGYLSNLTSSLVEVGC